MMDILRFGKMKEKISMNNMIIATTPLQAKIAMYIQKEYPQETFITLYITPIMNERHQFYFKDFTAVYCLQKKEEITSIIEKYSGNYHKIFFASFDHPLILDLVASSTYKHLMIFDDGYANIYLYGMYALPLVERQVGQLGLSRDNLIQKTEKHYTLYDSSYHVVDLEKLVYLKDFFKREATPVSNGKYSGERNFDSLL